MGAFRNAAKPNLSVRQPIRAPQFGDFRQICSAPSGALQTPNAPPNLDTPLTHVKKWLLAVAKKFHPFCSC